MTDTVEPTRVGIMHVHETELLEWYDVGWAYVGPSDREEFCVISWPHDRAPVAPFKDRAGP